jgi:hypothetical protein
MPIYLATGAFRVRFHEEGHEQDTVRKLFLSKNFVAEQRKEIFALAMRYIEKKRVKGKYGEAATFEIVGTFEIYLSVRNRLEENKRIGLENALRMEQEELAKEVKFKKTKYGEQGMIF